ncbi:MAG: hypothetical protein R8M37_04215 [Alphaproteobacteria bacterium]|nr:hypothetical protein [Alphaproteobacteria bacterium]
MIKLLKNIFTNKYAILWTVGYIFVMWAVLYFLFNFSIFNADQWHRLFNARLQGFAGFVFGILILAALPMYVATMTLIVRKNMPLITIPKISMLAFFRPVQKEEIKTEEKDEIIQTEKSTKPELPPELPRELHSVFLRARENVGLFQNMDSLNSEKQSEMETVPIMDALPLPSDFDVSFDNTPGFQDSLSATIPTFTDISFDAPSETTFDEDIEDFEEETVESKLIEYLSLNNVPFEIAEDIVVTSKYAIAVHEDEDFWATDETNWFASGKVRPSPIIAVKKCAQQFGVIPAIYLGADNILDIENLIEQWESDGIVVLRKLEDIQ